MPLSRRLLSFLPLIVLLCHMAAAQNPLRLVPVAPCRLVDTRQSNGGNGPIVGGTAQAFNLPQLASSGGSQAKCTPFSLASAAAYSLNVTLVPPSGAPVAYLTIWPTGEPQPLVSLMNSLGRTAQGERGHRSRRDQRTSQRLCRQHYQCSDRHQRVLRLRQR